MENTTKTFKIERIDPLGQGVALGVDQNDKITFIPKTLPGEEVKATIVQEKGKKVQFAELDKIETKSPSRQDPACPHFGECQGCSFLHTDYKNEVQFKKEAYSYLFKNLIEPEKITYVEAPSRLGYRNRIQLHYDLENDLLGFKNRTGIHPVKECLIAHPIVKEKLNELYLENSWQDLLSKNDPFEGHIEIILRDGVAQVAVNKPYSDGGFTQVFDEMGLKAREIIESFLNEGDFAPSSENATLELFGGYGFLSENLQGPKVLCDSSEDPTFDLAAETNFVGMNLYGKWATAKIAKVVAKKEKEFPTIKKWNLIVDPPRSGLKTIDQFTQLKELKGRTPKMAYLSCHPQSQKRDLETLLNDPSWTLEKLVFLDFFPATHHLESLALLKRT